ncbi:MAG TPA: ABC transporter permease [Caldisericia bacterium]|nr:ABC transporter permease [Caldisericia bacterium]HPF48265.1 ABC transporter permease [Caldisericia bacterium]HPI83799.1 ABC transporter permease [Caldisericia bacterium]HPQ92718.1 ABC transporter permease [Caldisericia bacterium]HRV74184.1 ABC transporter permease [Caldisericia bacterium]
MAKDRKNRKKVTVIDNPNEQEILKTAEYSMMQAIWSRFRRHKLAVVGLVIFLFMLVFSLAAPLFEVVTGYPKNYTSLHIKSLPGSIPGIAVSITDPDWNNTEVYENGKEFWFTNIDEENGTALINMTTFENEDYKRKYRFTLKSLGDVDALDSVIETKRDDTGAVVRDEDGKPIREKVGLKEYFIGRAQNKRHIATGQILTYMPPKDGIDTTIDPSTGNGREEYVGPAPMHILGTDGGGHDVLPRLAYGGRISLMIAFSVTFITGLVGIFFGALAGFFGGFADALLLRVIELMGTIPLLPIYMVLVKVIPGGQTPFALILIFSVFGWAGHARMVRGTFFRERSQEYCESAKAIGAGNMRIMFKHLLPNAIAPVITSMSLGVGSIILSESSLSFLGLGADPLTTPTWGALIFEANQYFLNMPWPGIFAGLLIFMTVVSFFFMGDGLRDALDPRQKI